MSDASKGAVTAISIIGYSSDERLITTGSSISSGNSLRMELTFLVASIATKSASALLSSSTKISARPGLVAERTCLK